jgi:signal peptidase I
MKTLSTTPPALPHGDRSRKRRFGWPVIALLAVLGFLLMYGLPLFLRRSMVQAFKISSGAMQPTLMGQRKSGDGNTIPGDYVFVEKVTKRAQSPLRGDIIVFRTDGLPLCPARTCYVKRVIGLPGENVSIDPPSVLVDGKRITEPPILEEITKGEGAFSGFRLAVHPDGILNKPTDTITLGPDEYFVLGDNTANSKDSRYFGPVPRDSIVGRVVKIYWPPSRIGSPE